MTDQEILIIFTRSDGNINTSKIREQWLNNHLEIKEYLEHRYDPELFMGYSYVIGCIFKGLTELPKCPTCRKILKKLDIKHCSYSCAALDVNVINKRKDTNLKNYGVEHILQSEEFKEKAKQTLFNRTGYTHNSQDPKNKEKVKNTWSKKSEEEINDIINKRAIFWTNKCGDGVINAYQAEECKEKAKQTKLEKYNDPYYSNIEKNKQTKLKNWGDPNYNNTEKSQQTKLERYNDKGYNGDRVKAVEKYRQTCLENYGVDSYSKTEEFKEKSKETWLNNLGVDHPFKSDIIKEKAQKTCLDRYGTKHYAQSNEYFHKRFRKYYYDNLYFDSSWELAFYIYYKDKGYEIKRETKKFEYYFNNKKHYYFPDFEINGKLYEIKGKHLIDKETGKWIDFYGSLENSRGISEVKHQCALANNVEIISDCKEYFKYINEKYGKNFIKSCKCKNKHELKNEEDND